MPGIAVVFIVIACLLLIVSMAGIYKFSGQRLTPSRRQQAWQDIHKPTMKIQHDAQRDARIAAREAAIRSHWASRIKRAKKRDPARAADLEKMADKEVKLDRRMHGLDKSANRQAARHMPKIDPRTGQIKGGIGRAGTKASHMHNPDPKKIMQPRRAKAKKSKARKTLKDIVIGDSGNWRGKK